MLKDFQLASGFSIEKIAECTPRFSSSDLKELCRNAAMMPFRELVRQAGGNLEVLKDAQKEVRLLKMIADHPAYPTHYCYYLLLMLLF
jgi:SpoVK/Ycf46/Vps4 family AAA+-type ATPase